MHLSNKTKVIVQGVLSRDGASHTSKMINYGTNVVAGVDKDGVGNKVNGFPVFKSFSKAMKSVKADVAVMFTRVEEVVEAVFDATSAGIKLIVLNTENIPLQDLIKIHHLVKENQVQLIGPDCSGAIVVDEALFGVLPTNIFKKGKIAILGKAGTLSYEVVDSLTKNKIGQSCCIVLGGESMPGTTFVDVLPWLEEDNNTEAVVLLGEIGGTEEEAAAEYIKTMTKPVVSYIVGRSAPERKVMGHRGAIVTETAGSYMSKYKALVASGVSVAQHPEEIAILLSALLKV
jgi:succinyl-CoA synthetase alpha subunit